MKTLNNGNRSRIRGIDARTPLKIGRHPGSIYRFGLLHTNVDAPERTGIPKDYVNNRGHWHHLISLYSGITPLCHLFRHDEENIYPVSYSYTSIYPRMAMTSNPG